MYKNISDMNYLEKVEFYMNEYNWSEDKACAFISFDNNDEYNPDDLLG